MLNFLNFKKTKYRMNKLGQDDRPFLFIISYDLSENLVIPLDEINPETLRYDFNNTPSSYSKKIDLKSQKISFEKYEKAFNAVKQNISIGNSFLTNLTASVPLKNDLDLLDVYKTSSAKYKLWIKDLLVCFSPETFVKVNNKGEIATFPMKGTIDASILNAENILKSDKKELYEHTTVVDLLRNDISKIAHNVRVERFRYIDKIRRGDSTEILQMSSEIRGQLPTHWKDNVGDWFMELLPAGSICGAPKPKTLEIIKDAEKTLHQNGKRGFYTGVFGIYDGKNLQSAVMIRFIEKTDKGLVFKSGGGITYLSELEKEFSEVYQKVYVAG